MKLRQVLLTNNCKVNYVETPTHDKQIIDEADDINDEATWEIRKDASEKLKAYEEKRLKRIQELRRIELKKMNENKDKNPPAGKIKK